MAEQRWKKRPEGSNWGDFGPDDQRGRLNLLTPQKVLQGIAEVRKGLAFCLSLPLDYPGGNAMNVNRLPPILRPLLRKGGVNMNYQYQLIQQGRPDVLSDDLAILHLQYSTQWDALSHVGALFDADDDGVPEPLYYNGFSAGGDIEGPSDLEDCGIAGPIKPHSTSCAHALGIERMAETCVQGRGVLIDLHHHFGLERTHIGYDELMRVMDADKVEVEAGDIVCLHTGYADALLGMNRNPDPAVLERLAAVLDGHDSRLLNWITDSNLVAIAADNYSVEIFPAGHAGDCCSVMPLHHHCLFKLGVHLGELWHLTPLANWLRANGRNRFLLTAPPLRLPGAVGAPLNPIATV